MFAALRTGGGLRQLIQLGAEATRPDDVRKTSPFLWLCIMAFTTKSSERRKVLASEIRHVIGTKMIVEGQRNTDFLQGLLLYVSWGHYTIFGAPVILSSVMQLAVGMLGDLGLKRPPPNDSPSLLLNYDARGNPKPFLPAVRTLDDRRIAISCWSLSQLYHTPCFKSESRLTLTVFRRIFKRLTRCVGYHITMSVCNCLWKMDCPPMLF